MTEPTRRRLRTPGERQAVPDSPVPAVVADDGLPDADSIDPKKLTGPVLTRQGWLCPDESGKRAPDSLRP